MYIDFRAMYNNYEAMCNHNTYTYICIYIYIYIWSYVQPQYSWLLSYSTWLVSDSTCSDFRVILLALCTVTMELCTIAIGLTFESFYHLGQERHQVLKILKSHIATQSATSNHCRADFWEILPGHYRSAYGIAVTLCNTLQHAGTRWNTLQHTTTHCNALPGRYRRVLLRHTVAHCNTLQHTATHLGDVRVHTVL